MPIAIGDIAGEFKTLMFLIDKLPKNKEVITLGDHTDRGSQSREVIEYCMLNPLIKSIRGNHCEMFIHYMRDKRGIYENGLWFVNGGWKTLESYGAKKETFKFSVVSQYEN